MTKRNKYTDSTDFEDFIDEYLRDADHSRGFLNASLEAYIEDGDFKAFMHSLELVIKSRQSIKSFSEEANLNRANLYDMFKGKKSPQFKTILKILTKLGYTLKVA